MTVLLDLGNSRLKWARCEAGRRSKTQALPWSALERSGALASLLEDVRRSGGRVLAASVAGDARESRIARELTDAGWPAPSWVRTPPEACGVRNGYRAFSRLGVDRFLGMVAALHTGHAPCVVVSAGTAVTLDALAADGRHLGGLIAPGPRLMQQALHDAAAQLPPPGDAAVLDRAEDTESAIASGCWQAAAALIERFHARCADTLGDAADVLICGGDAERLATMLTLRARVQPDLVLEGLAVWDAMQAPSA